MELQISHYGCEIFCTAVAFIVNFVTILRHYDFATFCKTFIVNMLMQYVINSNAKQYV